MLSRRSPTPRVIFVVALVTALVAAGWAVAVGPRGDSDRGDGPHPVDSIEPVVEVYECATETSRATTVPAMRTQQVVAVEGAVDVAFAPDGSIWVGTKSGLVTRHARDAVGPPGRYGEGREVVDLTGEVGTEYEQGLLAIEFSPDGRYLYTNHAGTPDGSYDTVVTEWEVSGDETSVDGRREVLRTDQPGHQHNGGGMHFGPDGFLYLSLGDGMGVHPPDGPFPLLPETGERAQDLTQPHGAILRIDPRPADDGSPYRVPEDNPLVGRPGASAEQWVWGLRNPWQFSFDRATGDMWIGDVGQYCAEEVDLVPSGASGLNFGWPAFEGTYDHMSDRHDEPPEGWVPPLVAYGHEAGQCSVAGGFVYRGSAIPDLVGSYLFADMCSSSQPMVLSRVGDDWALWSGEDAATSASSSPGGSVGDGPFPEQIVGFAEDPAGELYAISLSEGVYAILPG